ncbi:Uma2 family endonuclease [Synechocystis sp. FACHB-383]|uniref:Uma2 family endonuclease n=1 Tax=Synechocystis sp. FACHB-383 TaxID=2692864 RepID=UPI001687B763|nr:Uma2 family endonuclease [Synechocystis sp. FACHB-383]MBD2653284.1 Uma2 family endonuclease [Synechocystis sp. FACHB-383]
MVQSVDHPKSLSLNIPEELALQVTPAQFAVLAAENRDLRLERTATGVLIVNPPTGGETGNRNAKIITQLGVWGEANDTLGIAFDSSTGFELPNGANRSPDASWLARERWQTLTPKQRQGFIPLCPDFVVELRSPTDSLKKIQEKMQEYMENGTKLGWLIDPKNRRVEIYRSCEAVEVLENPSTLSGETVLPGFILSLQRIFPS